MHAELDRAYNRLSGSNLSRMLLRHRAIDSGQEVDGDAQGEPEVHSDLRTSSLSDPRLRSEIAARLHGARFLEGLSEPARNSILSAASYRQLSRHSVVTKTGGAGRSVVSTD